MESSYKDMWYILLDGGFYAILDLGIKLKLKICSLCETTSVPVVHQVIVTSASCICIDEVHLLST